MKATNICPTCLTAFQKEFPGTKTSHVNPLHLDQGTGEYTCAGGHSFSVKALAAALKAGKTAHDIVTVLGGHNLPTQRRIVTPGSGTKTAPKDEAEEPVAVAETPAEEPAEAKTLQEAQEIEKNGHFLSQTEAETSDQSGDETPAKPVLSYGAEVSHPSNDVLLLPNGDMRLTLVLREFLVGPVTELAAGMDQTVEEWVQGNVDEWIAGYFVVPMP